MISVREAWEERAPAAALKNIQGFAQLLSGRGILEGRPQVGPGPGREGAGAGGPAPYHYGSSRLGPQGLQHLPLHQEVGQDDERRDLCDGGNGKGPLREETRAAGPPSARRAHRQRFPLGQLRVPGRPWAGAAPQVGNAPPPASHSRAEHTDAQHTDAQHTGAHSAVFSEKSAQGPPGPRPSAALLCPEGELQGVTAHRRAQPEPAWPARAASGREGGKEGGRFFTRSQRVVDRVGTGRPGLLLPQRSTPLRPPGVSRPFKWGRVLSAVPAAEAEEPGAPRPGHGPPRPPGPWARVHALWSCTSPARLGTPAIQTLLSTDLGRALQGPWHLAGISQEPGEAPGPETELICHTHTAAWWGGADLQCDSFAGGGRTRSGCTAARRVCTRARVCASAYAHVFTCMRV